MAKKYYKLNQYIKAPEVRVIDETGENIGVIATTEALFKARQKGLDLVEVTEKANPPVCRIVDFRKFRYNEQKKTEAGNKKGKSQDLKEVRFTPFIGRSDLENRVKKIRSFLEDGDKVKLAVKFVGRQITRKDFGDRVMNEALELLGEEYYKVESEPKLQGKMLSMVIKPTGQNK
ncbi:translation initiation factor IF-3 [Candidatus Beckwithbacteria bacterium]|nr:translation initiation factor IF-3 [Candidatus Beckwithbacteria bacterium]